jgi:ribosome-associated toxin RatA of RatAB toxin-antitoxin module
MPSYAGESKAVIESTPEQAFAALLDYEHLSDWQGAVRSATVLSRDDRGRGAEVAYEIDVKLGVVRYTLRHGYDEPRRITSEYVDGDFRDCHGEWTFREHSSGTEARFALEIDPGRLVPRAVVRMLNERVMKASVDDLRKRFASGGD